jgi:hypothetical protein
MGYMDVVLAQDKMAGISQCLRGLRCAQRFLLMISSLKSIPE